MKYSTKKLISYAILSIFICALCYLLYCNTEKFYTINSKSSCSTFLINKNDTLLVAHNLDDDIEVPGAVFVNKRGIRKENIGWSDFTCLCAKKKSNPRIQWISKYGSITYNTWGKEFIDGGVNEKGLYVGEMTLFGTKWIKSDKPTFHHHFYMQYVLDNFANVDEAIENISKISIDGHCQWHYFFADRRGKTAIVEIFNDTIFVYQDLDMPIQALGNRSYRSELKRIPKDESTYNLMLEKDYYEKDLRVMYTAKKTNEYNKKTQIPLVDYTFGILKYLGMDNGYNKWSVVYDLKNLRMYFKTNKSSKLKYIDFNDFDGTSTIKLFDIHTDISGNVSDKFIDYTPELNSRFVKDNFAHINFGFFGNIFFKPRYISKLNKYANSFDRNNEK